jgi:hypothetical protein
LELIAQVGRKVRLRDYLYVGFGGPFFEDFKAIHSRLGIRDMLSVEMDDWVFKRQKNNVPYGLVRCKPIRSAELIKDFAVIMAEFPKAKHVLCWLDYASPKQLATQLAEVRTLLPKLSRHDIVKVTFNANPAALGDIPAAQQVGPDLPERRLKFRLDKLQGRLGNAFPGNAGSEDMLPENYPKFLLRILTLQISNAMKENPELQFQPLGCYVYADSEHQMLTCTGILLKQNEGGSFVRDAGLKKLEFASLNWEIHHIDVPYLSAREKLLLDREMFDGPATELIDKHDFWFDKDKDRAAAMITNYGRFYRFYPHYHRVQY